jgi:hypothetical protein
MTTLATIALRVARVCTDVLDGTATAGAATSLTDTGNLIQNNEYWDRGTLWLTSGLLSGRVLPVSGYALNKLTFATVAPGTVAVGNRFSVARRIYPWNQIVSAVNEALEGIHVIDEDVTLIGDGETLEFTLPDGVSRIARVEIENAGDPLDRFPSTHWAERAGEIRFHDGYAPRDTEPIHLFFRAEHPHLSTYSDEINPDVNMEWLRWKAAECLLYWGMEQYGEAKEFRIEERMNRALERQKGIMPAKPVIIVQTAGGTRDVWR